MINKKFSFKIIDFVNVRKEQEKAFILKNAANSRTSSRWFGYSFSKSYFAVDVKTNMIKFYKDAKNLTNEKGSLDLFWVSDIILSKVMDAPAHSLDLVTADRHYTIVAESHNEMVRWAFAINHCRAKNMHGAMKSSRDSTRFHRYEVTFPVKSQLHLNVMGSMSKHSKSGEVVRHWMIVVGFEKTESGGPGLAEQTGKIMKKDFIEAVSQWSRYYSFNI